MTRQGNDLNPAGGWQPEQDLTVEQALSLFTTQAAFAAFREDRAGSIKAGKSADFVVLDEDIFEVCPDALVNMEVQRTYIRGNCEYRAD
ncbi:MAG: amidohydrolase family protein [Clostridia bacterium]|nr:amidohydrolase family protein [Clostridia bacterium]